MFYYKRNQSLLGSAFTTAELVFHAVVRNVRSQHSNAVIAIVMNIIQVLALVVVFYLIMSLVGTRVAKIRGEYVLYLLSGVFLFLTHIKAVGSVAGVGIGNNPMMLHSPMNIMVMLMAGAFGSFYTQIVSLIVILFLYSVTISPIEIQDPGGAFAMLVLAWFTGCTVGLIFMALKAGLIMAVFMHLAWERLALTYAIVLPPLAMLGLLAILVIESDYTAGTRVERLGQGGAVQEPQ